MKAPFVRRAKQDGKDVFHLIAALPDKSQPGFYHLQSEDLVNWQVGASGNILVKPSSSETSKAESPEWIYDESTSNFYFYWSATSSGKNSIYLSTTKDWKRFSTPRVLYSPSYSVYDMHIEKTGDTYTGFFYNSDKSICQTQIKALKVSGTSLSEPQRIFSSQIPKSRAPQMFPALTDTGWFLLYNLTGNDRQTMSRSGNPAESKWYPCDENELSLPEEAEEGSVIVITTDELANILDNFFYEECDVLPTAETEPQTWLYQTATSTSSGIAWTKPGYRETGWQEGLSGFGKNNPPGSHINTAWTSYDIRLRYHLDLTGFTPEQMSALTGRIHHDEDVTVYFNGVVAFQESGYLTAYKNIALNQEAIDALTADDTNIIAIECTDKGGGAYIDFGLKGIRPIPTNVREAQSFDLKAQNDGAIYDLSGRKIIIQSSSLRSGAGGATTDGQLSKGVYIINGKKTLVK